MSSDINSGFWDGRRVLVTGHTGFKGAWSAMLLHRLGAEVTGYALDPPHTPSLFDQAAAGDTLSEDIRADVRDRDRLDEAVRSSGAEVVLHMAAQSLVRPSYDDPVETFQTNVQGTVNLLESCRHADTVRSVVVVTSDKAYANQEWVWGYRETDRLGGSDPYSASKSAAEIVAASYRTSFFADGSTRLATARAGNVIGGGDWSHMRLLPDLMRGFLTREEVVIRSPRSVRPWQHALEPLSGYLTLAEALYHDRQGADSAWNFGPGADDMRTVEWVCRRAQALWGDGAAWRIEALADGRETELLRLDTTKARTRLDWSPVWPLETGLDRTIEWYRAVGDAASDQARTTTLSDVDAFLDATARERER